MVRRECLSIFSSVYKSTGEQWRYAVEGAVKARSHALQVAKSKPPLPAFFERVCFR